VGQVLFIQEPALQERADIVFNTILEFEKNSTDFFHKNVRF
jgi:hypothetical protein